MAKCCHHRNRDLLRQILRLSLVRLRQHRLRRFRPRLELPRRRLHRLRRIPQARA
jgi:hypothetical protein